MLIARQVRGLCRWIWGWTKRSGRNPGSNRVRQAVVSDANRDSPWRKACTWLIGSSGQMGNLRHVGASVSLSRTAAQVVGVRTWRCIVHHPEQLRGLGQDAVARLNPASELRLRHSDYERFWDTSGSTSGTKSLRLGGPAGAQCQRWPRGPSA